jgi:nitroreductase
VNALAALLERHSVAAERLGAPGPDAAQVDAALDAALCAPDHGRLQPWRFRLIRGAARDRFGELLAATTLARDPLAPAAQLDKLRRRPQHAPLVIVVTAQLRVHPKVPEVEQLLSTGAAAMNLLNAFHAQGFGAIWLTGPAAYDPQVAAQLGCAELERIVGFIYVGSICAAGPRPLARPARAAFVREWPG